MPDLFGSLAVRNLPAKPNLERLKAEAKQRLEDLRAGAPSAKLAEAQHRVAREYGFAHWRELKADIERRTGAQATPASGPAIGDWIGELPLKTRVALHIRAAAAGRLSATVDSHEFGFFGLAADDVAVEDGRLSFALLAPLIGGFHQALYEARWDADGDRWIGEWTAHGMTTALDFSRGTYPPAPRIESLEGFWDGRVETPDGLIRIIIRFKTDEHGTFAWLDCPERMMIGRPAVSVARLGRRITVVMKTITVVGDLTDDGEWIEGRLIKGQISLPLTLIHRPPGAAAPLPQRAPAIALHPEALAAFAGVYEMESGLLLTVSVEKGRLHMQPAGGPKLDLLGASPTRFFWRIMDATAEFEVDDGGRVAALVIRQNGRTTRAVRLAASAEDA